MILEHPIVKEIFDDMETDAINAAVSAKLTDKETPAVHLAEVRVIRSFRSRLSFLIADAEQTAKRERAAR
jgi:hypothetical protein